MAIFPILNDEQRVASRWGWFALASDGDVRWLRCPFVEPPMPEASGASKVEI